ncbi:hypothetical protein ABEB36_004359 [Hypothenemus hampei]|uniref:39S ribosomal protein L1, mitochondrial n=1 Tax=Hypothenemus hampei TaxID=57062 RepID=A0ABD1F672_HYPHA
MNFGRILFKTRFPHVSNSLINRGVLSPIPDVNIQFRNYAARKGTRERKRKAKVKVEIQKVGFIPHNLRNREKMLASRPSKKFDDSMKRDPIDDVFAMRYYKWITYSFEEAVRAHRETHHPEIYNKPDANLYVTIELNMQGEKKTRFVDNFKRIAEIPHPFDHEEDRTLLVFAKDEVARQQASEAGAQLVGDVELIKQIQNGQVVLQDFQYFIAHPDILPELVVLRGVMKKKFPNPKAGTLDPDLKRVVKQFLHGINYQAIKDEYEKDFGQINAVIGPLTMSEQHLEANFAALINDVYDQKPRREGGFIRRCLLWSPPSREKLKIAHEIYLSNKEQSKNQKDEENEPEEAVAL